MTRPRGAAVKPRRQGGAAARTGSATKPATKGRPAKSHPADVTAASHHSSHRGLLQEVAAATAPTADFDAIIVPTNRPVAKYLRDATGFAHDLRTRLVPICSGQAAALEAATLGNQLQAPVTAIDFDVELIAGLMPRLRTSKLMAAPKFVRFGRTSDLSLKRNLGLLLARAAGWRRVLFLDDDIASQHLSDLRAAAGLLAQYDIVGLQNEGFEDNSVVCHAYRDTGGRGQETFIGGGAMAVAPREIHSFFPDIYSEDWFFFYRTLLRGRVAVTGSVHQERYDPYLSPGRAAAEEFGDCLGEGVFCVLDDCLGKDGPGDGDREIVRRLQDPRFWSAFIDDRRRMIADVLPRVKQHADPERRQRMRTSLMAAEGINSAITPERCVDFVTAWQEDLQAWEMYLKAVPTYSDLGVALKELGLDGVTASSAWPGR